METAYAFNSAQHEKVLYTPKLSTIRITSNETAFSNIWTLHSGWCFCQGVQQQFPLPVFLSLPISLACEGTIKQCNVWTTYSSGLPVGRQTKIYLSSKLSSPCCVKPSTNPKLRKFATTYMGYSTDLLIMWIGVSVSRQTKRAFLDSSNPNQGWNVWCQRSETDALTILKHADEIPRCKNSFPRLPWHLCTTLQIIVLLICPFSTVL